MRWLRLCLIAIIGFAWGALPVRGEGLDATPIAGLSEVLEA